MTVRVCLVKPPCRSQYCADRLRPPLGLLSLAASAERVPGCDVALLDLDRECVAGRIPTDEAAFGVAAHMIASEAPDIIGITTRCDTLPSALRIAEECRQLMPTVAIVLGGPGCSGLDVTVLERFPQVSVVARGEGEASFSELVARTANHLPPDAIAGITRRLPSGQIQRGPDLQPIADLDAVPMPEYELLGAGDGEVGYIVDEVEAGRGCHGTCVFCSTARMWKRPVRYRTPALVIDEMHRIASRFGTSVFSLIHDNLTASPEWIEEFCAALIAEGCPHQWMCSCRTDELTPGLLGRMKAAGLVSVFLGIETGSQRVQQRIGKRLDLLNARGVVADCSQRGIRATLSFIVGLPGELSQETEQTIALAFDLAQPEPSGQVRVQVDSLKAYPGCPVFTNHKDKVRWRGPSSATWDTVLSETDSIVRLIRAHPDVFTAHFSISDASVGVEDPDLIAATAGFLAALCRRSSLMAVALLGIGYVQLICATWQQAAGTEPLHPTGMLKPGSMRHHPQMVRRLFQYAGRHTDLVDQVLRIEEKLIALWDAGLCGSRSGMAASEADQTFTECGPEAVSCFVPVLDPSAALLTCEMDVDAELKRVLGDPATTQAPSPTRAHMLLVAQPWRRRVTSRKLQAQWLLLLRMLDGASALGEIVDRFSEGWGDGPSTAIGALRDGAVSILQTLVSEEIVSLREPHCHGGPER